MAERYTDFKKGDIVRIRSWEDMENEYGLSEIEAIKCRFRFTPQMRIFCEEKAQITQIRDGQCYLNFEKESLNGSTFCFSSDMIELFEESKVATKEVILEESNKFNEVFSQITLATLTDEKRELLISQIDGLLSEYDYHQKHDPLNKIVNTWFYNKRNLISLFKQHPNYNGNYQIVFEQEYSRTKDEEVLLEVLNKFYHICSNKFYGCILDDEEKRKWRKVWRVFDYLSDHVRSLEQTITQDIAGELNDRYEGCHARAGQKLSKVIGKLARESGLNKEPEYNELYPRLGDAINPLYFKRKTVLSVNPIDYYTMSFGDTWQSCHTIDKRNKRRNHGEGYQGCYSSGTESYMLDGVSFVFYTINEELEQNKGKAPELCDKAQRCMFHLGEDKLIQGRVYPQGTDGAAEVYRQIREIVQRVISECFGLPNYWDNKKGTYESSRFICSEGTHYRDYSNFDDCNVSFLKNEFKKNAKKITVGHNPICPSCGYEHEEEETIECEDCWEDNVECACCGYRMRREDARLIDGQYYCDDCTFYCEYHEEYEAGNYSHVRHYGNVCRDALENTDNFVRCEECDAWLHVDDCVITEDGNYFCDEDCAEEQGYYNVNGVYVQVGEEDDIAS